ncbi:MAG: DNA alkylation repair protein, partial [Candidatus Acidiferrales bacterium]
MTSARKPALKSAQRRARKTAPAKTPANGTRRPLDGQVRAALSSLKQMSTPRDRENLKRFGITANKAFGVSMANMQLLAKRLGRNHEVAAALWDTGWYEAR